MTDVVSIKTGKPVVKPPRKKNSQDAKRWRYLLEKLESHEMTLMSFGIDIVESGYLQATIDEFDDRIYKSELAIKKRREYNRRQQSAKEKAGLIAKDTD